MSIIFNAKSTHPFQHDIRKILELAHVTPSNELKVDYNEFERIILIANQHLHSNVTYLLF